MARPSVMRQVIVVALLAAVAPLTAAAQSPACGQLANAYGPFDYRYSPDRRKMVEPYHFTPDVEALRHGATSTIGGDIDYTLRAFPNHHRALNAMVKLALRLKTQKPRGAEYTIDCYFDRAIRFAPDDGLVLVIYGVYLSQTNRNAEAVRVLEQAKKHGSDNPNLYYNLGLIYFDLKDYAKALANAHKAYDLGAALPGLRNKLEAAGKWRDAAPGDNAAAARQPPSNQLAR